MPKALVVEDDQPTRVIAKKMLETVGFEVDEAEDGVICLEIVKKNRYDVILLDIHMPRMDGEQVFTLV